MARPDQYTMRMKPPILERLRAASKRRKVPASELARTFIERGLDELEGLREAPLTRPEAERILVALKVLETGNPDSNSDPQEAVTEELLAAVLSIENLSVLMFDELKKGQREQLRVIGERARARAKEIIRGEC